jgi:hypothetical protein
MKYFVCSYIIFLLLAGACGSKKTTLTGDTRIIENTSTQAKAVTRTDSTASVQLSEAEQKNIDSEAVEQKIRIEFDTEKPINSDTKLPPVQSVEITVKGQKTGENSAKTTEQSSAVNYDRAIIEELNSQTAIDRAEKTTEETASRESQLLKWIAIISTAAAAIFICITVKKALQSTGIISKVVSWIKGLFKK